MQNFKYINAALIIICIMASCKKAELNNTEVVYPEGQAFIRIALLSPGIPSVMIKANDVKLNGGTTGFLGAFPSTFTSPDYAAVAPSSTIKLALPNAGTQNDSVVLFNNKLDIAAGKFYSLTLADTGINRTTFAIEDEFLPKKDSFLSVRLINAMVGSTLNLIRIDSTDATNVVRDTLAKNIPYKGTSGFIQVKTFTNRAFIRIRIVSSITGRNYLAPSASAPAQGPIPPQTMATGSRRSITYYAYGFENGTGIYAPALSAHITNQ